ncbi:hypothetical protein CC78DRAFT_208402 [Lojkania enalia]|uniref:Apple domain-containing protein n=1 Tax=Lojkania enalia TaxID=147567 RepID=A0A9P4KB19_9PLEO|nr:hypothetical protein CC78DRAFT_208402 [Didymosphaeria enalia]
MVSSTIASAFRLSSLSRSPREGLEVFKDGSSAPEVTKVHPYNFGYDDLTPKSKKRHREISCSVPRTTLWLCLLFTSIVVGGAVGGGVGGAFSIERARNKGRREGFSLCSSLATPISSSIPTSTISSLATASPTAYAIAAPSAVASLARVDCTPDAIVKSMFNATASFQMHCEAEFTDNDHIVITAYAFDDCISACERLNAWDKGRSENGCMGITYRMNMAESFKTEGGNCELKTSSTGTRGNRNAVSAKFCRDPECKDTAF